LLCQRPVVRSMAGAQSLCLTGSDQLRATILPDRLQQDVARGPVGLFHHAEQVCLHEDAQELQDPNEGGALVARLRDSPTDLCDGLQRTAAAEDGQSAEEGLLARA